ncbi:23S rRNA (pseudouridine(1915)-N(3))-methyltransferase RlmH [Candidatus Peregrinibacteria bacterium]|nr:23S rRNA (pseudouridine(1915)-N(3))-methyltransferase RlmH [Candidatus Peregrinibacteria bacterium]
MKITIIQVGKTKQSFFQQSEAEFQKRLQTYADLQIVTISEHSIDDSSNQRLREQAKQKEAENILKALPKDFFIVVLDETGQSFDSPRFAQKLGQLRDFEGGKVCFIIGGPFGLSAEIKKQARLILSFSSLTFTHEIIRTLLLEQLYRAFTILQNKTYHY